MRRILTWIAAGSLALVGSAASAADQQDQLKRLQQMQQELERLENRAEAAEDELVSVNERSEQQQELIQSSGLAEARGASSSMSSFLQSLEIGGWVAASYNYNFSDLDGDNLSGGNTGGNGYPFHPDANSFSLDQVWFELEKPVSEDSRGGFRADIAFGKIAELLSNSGGFGGGDDFSGSDEDLTIYQAYVQYLAPIHHGVKIKAGKFATPIGAEVAQQPYNFNITRGQVYNLLQPITHVGVMASMENNGASAAIGLSNDTVQTLDVDKNNNKNLLWHLGYAEETWGASFNGLWGARFFGNERDKETILDLILSYDPSDQFSGYLNATWRETEKNVIRGSSSPDVFECHSDSDCVDATGWGVAAAGRFALSDRSGLALRGEYVKDKDSRFSDLSGATGGRDTDIITVTGTADHMLTEQLMLRAELRWDVVEIQNTTDDSVFDTDGSDEDHQFVGAVELLYSF